MLTSQMPSLEVVRSCFRLIAKGAVFAHSASQGQGSRPIPNPRGPRMTEKMFSVNL